MTLKITGARSELGLVLGRQPVPASAKRVHVNLSGQSANTLLHDGHAWKDFPRTLLSATRRSLLKIFVTAGFTVGAVGTGGGLLLGFLILTFRQGIVNVIQVVTGQNLWDPSVRFLTTLPSRADPVEIVGIASLALVLSFLATLYPAYKAASTDPVQVLRYE